MNDQWHRLRVALLLILAAIALCSAITHFMRVLDAHELSPVSVAHAPSLTTAEYGDDVPRGLFEVLAHPPQAATLPGGFCDEVLGVDVLQGAETYATDGVVGLYWADAPAGFYEHIAAELKENGWEHVGVSELSSSYIKADGSYRWLNIFVFNQDSSSAVVVQYRKEDT